MEKYSFETEILSRLIGLEVTEVICGGSNGSMIILDFDSNKFALFVYCVWRLESDKGILSGWNESPDSNVGNLTIEMNKLLGEQVKSLSLNNFFDLKIHFYSNKVLNVFCDVTPKYEPEDYDENWSFHDIKLNKSYIINRNFDISIIKYSNKLE